METILTELGDLVGVFVDARGRVGVLPSYRIRVFMFSFFPHPLITLTRLLNGREMFLLGDSLVFMAGLKHSINGELVR